MESTENLPILLREQLISLHRAYGGDSVATDMIGAIQETLTHYEGERSIESFSLELMRLYEMLRGRYPGFAGMAVDLQKLLAFLLESQPKKLKEISDFLDNLLRQREVRREDIMKVASELFQEKRTLLVQSHSKTLGGILKYCSQHAVLPKIIVAAQEPRLTQKLIRFLRDEQFEFTVVSRFSVSHLVEEIDLALFGTVTLTPRHELIMGPGASSLIAQIQATGVRSYVPLSSSRFSFWEGQMEKHSEEVHQVKNGDYFYERQVFWYDLVQLQNITGLITDTGILTPEDAVALYVHKHDEFIEADESLREKIPSGGRSDLPAKGP